MIPMPRLAAFALLAACAAPLAATGAAAQGAQQPGLGNSFGGLQVQGDQPIAIESNQLDVDDGQSLATFSGAVRVQQGETSMEADKLLVYYVRQEGGGAQPASAGSNVPGASSDISRLEATGGVTIRSAEQVATATKADFDMATQVAVLTGDVVLSQGENVATGCILRIQMDTGVARLQSQNCGGASGGGGRVRMLLSPGAGGAPTPAR